jgi:hypothetical protein
MAKSTAQMHLEYIQNQKKAETKKSTAQMHTEYESRQFASSLSSRLKGLDETRKGLYGDYSTRFFDKDGNLITSYRGDTGDALSNFETSKTDLDNQTKEILDGLTKYEKYLDADYVNGVRDYLTGYSSDLSGMYDTYKSDNDYFSQWENEDAYNYWLDTEEKKKKYAGMSDDELEAAKAEAEGDGIVGKIKNFFGYIPEASKEDINLVLERNIDNGIATVTDLLEGLGIGNADEIGELITLYGDKLSSALGVDYGGEYTAENDEATNNDISLINQEILARKYKLIDTSPEEINQLIERYTELERMNEEDTLVGIGDRVSAALVGGVSGYTENKSIDEEMAEIKKTLDFLCPDWEVLVSYNRIRRDEEANQYLIEGLRQSAEEHPVLTSLSTVAISPAKALGLIGMVDNVFDDTDLPTNPNSPYFMFNNMVDVPREEVMENYDWIDSNGTDWFDTVYGVGMSTADSLFATAVTGGSSWAGGALLGISAASDTAQQVALNGGSKGQALITGLFAGINEMLWEKISIGNFKALTEKSIRNLFSVNGVKTAVVNMFKSAGVNFTEEAATEASNLIVDYLVNGGLSAYAQAYEYYLSTGCDDATARENARNDMLKQVGEAGFNGALQGLLMGGTGIAFGGSVNAVGAIGNKIVENQYYNQQGKNIVTNDGVQDLVNSAKDIPALKKLADKVAGVKTEDVTSKKYEKQVGKLYKGVQEAQAEKLKGTNKSAFKNVIKAELEASGVANADKVADVLTKAMYGGGLTQAESKIIESVNGTSILNKALNSTEFSEKLSTEQKAQLKDNIGKYVDTRNLTEVKGEVIIDATDEKVDSMVVASLDGKDITLDVKTGDKHQTVKSGELRLSRGYEVVFEGLMDIKNDFGLDETTATKMLTLWEGYKGSAEGFIKAIESSFMYGQYNMRFDFDKSEVVKLLPADIRNQVYEMGREYKHKVTEEKGESDKKTATADPVSRVTFAEGVSYNELNKSQKAQVDFAQVIAKTFGFNLEIFRSPKNASGQSIGENGSYNLSTNTMRLDIDAGTLDGKSLILFTQSHELTHFIKKWSPEAYKTFADLLIKKYGEKGVSVDDLVKRQLKNSVLAEKTDKTGTRKALSYEEAFDEVVCNACEDFLADPNIQQTIAEIAEVDKTLAQKIKEFLKNIVSKLEEALKGLQGQSIEANQLRGLDFDDIQELKAYWMSALVESRENVLQARNNDAKAQKNTTDEGDVKMQIRYAEDGSKFVEIDRNLFAENQGKSIADAIRFYIEKEFNNLISVNGQSIQINKTTNDEWRVGRSIKKLLKDNVISYDDKIRTLSNADELLKAAKRWIGEKPSHPRNDDIIEFGRGRVLFRVDNKGYEADVLVGIRKNQKAVLYDLVNFKQKNITEARVAMASQNSQRSHDTSVNEEMLTQKTENVNTGDENQTIAGIDYNALSSAKNENGKELFQYRAIQHDVPEYRALLEKYSDMSSSQINDLFETMNKAFAIIEDNLEILDYAWDENLNEDGTWDDTVDARAFNPVKPNSDKLYKYSLDFSTLCRKRLLQQVITEELSLALDRAITKAEGIAIRNELIKLQEEGRQIEIACALCYVESARMKSPEQIQKFLNGAGQMVREFFATKAKSDIAEAEEKARKAVAKKYAQEIKEGAVSPTDTVTTKGGKVKYVPLTKLTAKMKNEIQAAKRQAKSSYSPSVEEQRIIDIASNLPVTAFTTADGLKNLAKENPVIFDAYTSFVRNATHSKGTEKDVWYRVGDANKIGDDLIAAMNKENGLRSQSWSDFQVIHLLDYVGAIIELSTKKAKMQSYTKVPDYVNLMGLTGQMINLSLIPSRDFNGKLEFDSVEGMAFKVARELRDKYPDTTGTISIGITNEQIQMLLESIDIDYVIPYHHSAMSKVVRKEMHIPSWVSYQEYQGEKKISSKKDALANAKKYGVQLLNANDENYHKAPSFSEWFDLDEARQVAQLENLNPTDPKAQKKYGVMYGGYKAMQNAADNYLRLCAERGLVPKFCHEKADFTTEENYWKLLIDRKMINQKTGEIIEQKPVQPIFNEGEVLNILNNEVARYEGVKEDFDYATRIVTEKFLNGEMNESISKIAKSIGDTVTNVTKVAILNSDVQGKTYNQDRDSTGRELTPEQVEFFKDSKVRDADGKLIPVYHGTPNRFTTFRQRVAQGWGKGIYFTDNKEDASEYGENIIEAYLNIINPYIADTMSYDNIGAEKTKAYRDFDMSVWEDRFDEYETYEDYKNDGMGVDMYDIYTEDVEVFNKILRELGYDGIIAKESNNINGFEIVAFNENQPKLTDNLNPTESEDIRYSDREVAPIEKEDYKKLKAHFGTTGNFDVAGYMLQDGYMLDFSGKHWGDTYSKSRQVDHRDIVEALGLDGVHSGNNGVDAMVDMIGNGNIRLMPEVGGINLSKPLTKQQRTVLSRYINYFNGEVIVDIDAVGGDTIHSFQYNKGTSHLRVLRDLDAYFKDGTLPAPQSSLTQFRYQDRVTPEQDAEYLELAKNPEKNEARLRELVDSVAKKAGYSTRAYHGTKAEFTKFSKEYFGSNFGEWSLFGAGFYFAPTENQARYWGSLSEGTADVKVMPVYLRTTNMILANEPFTNSKAIDIVKKEAPSFDAEDISWTLDRVSRFVTFLGHNGYTAKRVRDLFVSMGYDGVDYSNLSAGKYRQYAVFNPEQIKSAELVTYDDNGNIIPLSERFNEGNEDIRYQDRVYNGSLTQERIDDLIHDSGAGSRVDYANMWIASINPSDFIDLTLRYETRNKGRDVFDAEVEGDYGSVMGDRDYVTDLKNSRMPYLRVDIDTGKVIGHDGRHRMRALEKTGASRTPIGIIFEKDGRVYKGNDNGVRLETIEYMRLTSQFDDRFYSQHKASVLDIIPLNEDHRAEIEGKYRARKFEVKQGWTVAFQDRPVTDREILVDAMANSEELSIEDKNRLEIYREKIDNIYELEKELADTGKQIHKIITTKGSDRKQLASLNAKSDTLRMQISRLDGELLRIEAMKPMKNLVEIRKKQVLKAYKQKTQEQRHKNVEGRNKTAAKNKIKKVVKTLESLYSNPTKEKNVKIEFQEMVRTALAMSDVLFNDHNAKMSVNDILAGEITTRLSESEQKTLDEWGKIQRAKEGYQQRLKALESSGKFNQATHDKLLDEISRCDKKLKALSRKLLDVAERQRAEWNETVVQYAVDSLVKAYESLNDSKAGYAQAAYNEYVATRLNTLKESLANATAKTMTLAQLDELYQAYKMVLTSVRTANELFIKNKRMSVIDAGETVINEVKKVANVTDDKIAKLRGLRKFSWEELKPVYAFERIGSETFMELYKEVLRGQNVLAKDIAEAQAFFDEKAKAYGYKSWDLKERKDFILADGRVFNLDLEEIMSIYAYSKRDQALDHMTDGGFVFDKSKLFTDTKKKGLAGAIKRERTTVEAYRLNNEVFYKIINSLTEEQKKFVDDMQEYLSAVMGAKGNEVSRVLYGIDLFKEKSYFPLMSSEDFKQSLNSPAGEVELKNAGMTKETIPHAKNPIVLKSFMDVWAGHVNKMSTYHSFVLPIENLNKIFNYTGYAQSDISNSVRTVLEGAMVKRLAIIYRPL